MKKFVIVSAIFFLSSTAYAQETPTAAAPSAPLAEEARMKALEDQVRTLAEEAAVLRGELKAVRDPKSPEPASCSPVLLTSAQVKPAILPPNPSQLPAS